MARDINIPLEKGVSLNIDKISKNREFYEKYANFFTAYPDLFIDLITPVDSNFKLFFYQRIFLRVCMRYRYHYCVAPRAFSKSFIAVLAMYLRCMFLPGSKVFLCAPQLGQGTKIALEKITEIWNLFPLLQKEVVGKNFSKDEIRLSFPNASVFDIVHSGNATRGGRRSAGIIDETRDHDGDKLSEVILPLMNVNRRTANGQINHNEPHQNQIYITSAGQRSSFAYEKLIELLIMGAITPKNAFVWGCDYRVPLLHGLLDKGYVDEMKMSSTYKESSFAREYLSLWSGGNEDSWFDYDRMSRHRTMANPEYKYTPSPANREAFYLISVDVARLDAQTVITVFKIYPKDTFFLKRVVNIEVMHNIHFAEQAMRIKEMAESYHAEEIVIDGTGLGVGLLDFMILQNIDDKGKIYPAYGSFNDEDLKSKQPKDAINKIYVLKASPKLNHAAHSNCYTQIASGHIKFLISEQLAKNKLLGTKIGQKMSPKERMTRLRPHELTTRLFEEMANLKAKQTGNEIVLERINQRMTKDKFSSLEYGLLRIKEKEERYYKNKGKRKRDLSKFIFFN